ncbi:MAG: galactitol-1-phosphate 5-dehydrogenase [Acidocella sp. 20-57-95]|nr:MAG: galactitol-1-phosphate 5-dehydrogenase [Acidocella sp. 20-57-95]HQT64538.1 alcohol dehydrogenase catalytic domain-containing protein [Acidocella sp.]HQU04329.1 alcohol dehydrogenase catalytic domain-containing protein [Acidocella sp.]
MKALMYLAPGVVEYRDVPVPVAGPDEVLVKVEAVGICGSDMHAYHGHDERRPPPLVLGHEAAGVIAEGPRCGQRVTINPLVTCGHCEFCVAGNTHLCGQRQIISMPPRPGAFGEYVTIPERNVVVIPESMPFNVAALAEPLAVSWHAVRIGVELLRRPLAVATCCVLGGGAIGLGAALVLRRFGAHKIHLGEPNEKRRATAVAALPLNAYAPGTPAEPLAASVDFVIDAVGAKATREAASRLVKPGGIIIHAGLLPGVDGFDVRRITLQEVTVRGTYCYTQSDFRDVVDTLAISGFGNLNWVAQMPLSAGAQAFAEIDQGALEAAKILLVP